ncbi:unnamed protein product [Acidithrix sp. C25]|nr:unnamed protein product [Acidithrix sp. C25]
MIPRVLNPTKTKDNLDHMKTISTYDLLVLRGFIYKRAKTRTF